MDIRMAIGVARRIPGTFPTIRVFPREKQWRKVGRISPVKSFAENSAGKGLNVDGDINPSRQIELFQLINGLCSRFNDIDQTLVGTLLELVH